MPERTDIAYRYDGSIEGLMCCVFESFARHESPFAILPPGDERTVLFETRAVATDAARAERVLIGIRRRVGERAEHLVRQVMLTELPEKELSILAFLKMGFAQGQTAMRCLADPRLAVLNEAAQHLQKEAHLLKGFVRFREADGVLVAVIEPKNRALPLLADHFLDRYPDEKILIWDKRHGEALLLSGGNMQLAPLSGFRVPAGQAREDALVALWRRFHQTIAIAERVNPKLQRSLLPLRYRGVMCEFDDVGSNNRALGCTQ